MSEHTKEPWELDDEFTTYGGDDEMVSYVLNNRNCEENALRIVACVNACAGGNPEAIPGMVKALEYYAAKSGSRIARQALAKWRKEGE